MFDQNVVKPMVGLKIHISEVALRSKCEVLGQGPGYPLAQLVRGLSRVSVIVTVS